MIDDICARCDWGLGRHALWCWRAMANEQARQEIGELPKLQPHEYTEPPF